MKNPELLLFDSIKGSFDLNLARSRFEYLNSQYHHQSYMSDLEERLKSKEKHLDGVTVSELVDTGSDAGHEEEAEKEEVDIQEKDNVSSTLEGERRRFREEDKEFWEKYNHLTAQISNAVNSNSNEQLLSIINLMSKEELEQITDHLKRTFLHVAIEKGNNQLAKSLIHSGFNVNMKEGCGLTPLHIA